MFFFFVLTMGALVCIGDTTFGPQEEYDQGVLLNMKKTEEPEDFDDEPNEALKELFRKVPLWKKERAIPSIPKGDRY
jgi:hypothetical protein